MILLTTYYYCKLYNKIWFHYVIFYYRCIDINHGVFTTRRRQSKHNIGTYYYVI